VCSPTGSGVCRLEDEEPNEESPLFGYCNRTTYVRLLVAV